MFGGHDERLVDLIPIVKLVGTRFFFLVMTTPPWRSDIKQLGDGNVALDGVEMTKPMQLEPCSISLFYAYIT